MQELWMIFFFFFNCKNENNKNKKKKIKKLNLMKLSKYRLNYNETDFASKFELFAYCWYEH